MSGPRTRAERDAGVGAPAELIPLVERTRGLQPWRRVFHAANGVTAAFLPGWLGLEGRPLLAVLAAAVVVVFAADVARLRSARLNALFFQAFRSLASPREAAGIASSTWFLVGIALSYALFPLDAARAGILVLALGDPAAGTAGRLWGRRRLGKGTWVGSAAFFAATYGVLAAFLGPVRGLAAALVVTVIEILPLPLDDNVTLPGAAGAVAWMFGA